MTDRLARTIAALRRGTTASIVAETINVGNAGSEPVRRADILALCDAAERGMNAPPRELTQAMYDRGEEIIRGSFKNGTWADAENVWRAMCDAAPINEGGQDAAVGNDADARDAVAPSPPVPPSPDAPARTVQEIIGDPRVCVTTEAAAPAPDADGLIHKLRKVNVYEANEQLRVAAADVIAAQAGHIERLTRERDEARAECEKQERTLEMLRRDNTRKFEYGAKLAAECERLRACIEQMRQAALLEDWHTFDAALDAARGEGE